MTKKTKNIKEETYYLAVDENGLGFIFYEPPVRSEGCWLGCCRTTAIPSYQVEKHLCIGHELTFQNNPRKITKTQVVNLERY